jgi:hypothetical protein
LHCDIDHQHRSESARRTFWLTDDGGSVHERGMRLLVLCFALLAIGCPDRSISPVDPVQSAVYTKNIPVSADIDILFVIDNSLSTKDKQTIFADNFSKFVDSLDRFPTGRPNMHLGVVTSSVDIGADGFGGQCHPASGQNGLLQNTALDPTAHCQKPTTERYLVDVQAPGGGRTVNYTSNTLSDALSCISHVGEGGCGFEAPLEAMKRALDGSHPENAGFLRKGAFLAVVFLTDEDDCSAKPALFTQSTNAVGKDDFRCVQTAYQCDTPISPRAPGAYTNCRVRHDGFLIDPGDYAQFLSALKVQSGVAVAMIAGEPTKEISTGPLTMPFSQALALEPSCMATIDGNYAIGRPGLRLDEFLGNFGDRGLFRTVCQGDYSQALDDIGVLLFHAISPCLEGKLDTTDIDTENPGLQPECKVSDVQELDTDARTETQLLPCRMLAEDRPDLAGEQACWWVKSNPAACSTETHLEIHVERAAPPAPNTSVRVSCVVAGA